MFKIIEQEIKTPHDWTCKKRVQISTWIVQLIVTVYTMNRYVCKVAWAMNWVHPLNGCKVEYL